MNKTQVDMADEQIPSEQPTTERNESTTTEPTGPELPKDKGSKRISLLAVQSFFLRASLVLSVLLLVFVTIRELADKSFTIQPFSLPASVSQDGYTGEVLAVNILSNLGKMVELANERRTLKELDEYNDAADRIQVKLEVSGIAISPEAISSYLKRIFGINPRTIKGAIVQHEKSLDLILSISGHPTKTITESLDTASLHMALGKITRKAAEEILKAHNRLLAGLYFYGEEDMEHAIENFRAAIFEQPDLASKAYTHWGDAMLVATEDTVAASQLLRKALQINPKEGAAYRIFGTMYHFMSLPAKAERNYRKALELDPTSPHTWSHLGNRVLRPDKNREEEALACYRKAFELDHLFAIDLTELLYLRGEYGQAYEALQWVRYLEPRRGYSLTIAIAYAMKDTAQAMYVFNSMPDKTGIAEGLGELAYEQGQRKNLDVGFMLARLSLQADSSANSKYTYAILAVLHALSSDEEGFFSNVEKALQLGLDEEDLSEFEDEEETYRSMTFVERYKKLKAKYF